MLVALALLAIVAALVIGYVLGRARGSNTGAIARPVPAIPAQPESMTPADDAALAQARAETARYRQLVVDIENDAPPPLLGAPGMPDNLKLIVGVGPVLERMLYQLGITTYRQIALWTERDIDEFDARLPEFPGRIRRDDWVTQARALHRSAHGEDLPSRHQ